MLRCNGTVLHINLCRANLGAGKHADRPLDGVCTDAVPRDDRRIASQGGQPDRSRANQIVSGKLSGSVLTLDKEMQTLLFSSTSTRMGSASNWANTSLGREAKSNDLKAPAITCSCLRTTCAGEWMSKQRVRQTSIEAVSSGEDVPKNGYM